MKKRSLVAAVAMLLVSALVLTSATFAWFAKGNAATVTTMTTTVSNNDGALLVAAKNADGFWKTSIAAEDFINAGTFSGTATNNALKPVDMKLATLTSTPAWYGCSFDGYEYNGAAAVGDEYITYTWYIKSDKAGTIDLVPSFNAGTGAGFVYGLVIVNGTAHIYGTTSDSYVPFDDVNVKATEAAGGTAGVVDAAEVTQGALASTYASTVTNDASIQISATAGQAYSVECYIWAEGQDSGCTGAVSNTGATFSFAPTLTLA